ncbi:MAG: hypothetical protein ACI31G_01130 [Bacilli bacterium]
MEIRTLTQKELKEHVVGEAITLTAVLAVCAAALLAIVIYRLFVSNKGTVTVPGGWKFTWN